MDRGKIVAAGTPGSLKGNGGDNMRLEIILEPKSEMTNTPGFLRGVVVTGRRVIGRLRESDISAAIQWARDLKESGIAEEYAVGPVTLDDVYLNLVGRGENQEKTDEGSIHEATV